MFTLTKKAKKALPLSLIICFFICCLVINPQRYIQSIFSGMLLFAKNVAPALFPFFFFTKLLTGLGGANALGKALKKPVARLYNAPPESGYILVMSLISGYPIGAKLISDFYENGNFTIENCKKVSSFTSTSGPLFVVGTVGTLMLSSPKAGYVLFLCHALGALVNGLIYRERRSRKERRKGSVYAADSKRRRTAQQVNYFFYPFSACSRRIYRHIQYDNRHCNRP